MSPSLIRAAEAPVHQSDATCSVANPRTVLLSVSIGEDYDRGY
jgi:hypothetical protein